MIQSWIVILTAIFYFALLFGIAWWADRLAKSGKSIIANPYVYALSLAVYCTAWTFYGSIGRAANTGLHFLPVYLGPTFLMLGAGFWLRKIIRISKTYKITSIADFLASRYDKSVEIGILVSLIAIVGGIPYIALQLKAILTSFVTLTQFSLDIQAPFWADAAFYITLILALFAILFGTRHLNALERHEGMVATIAFESIIKLVAFLAGSIYVCYFVFSDVTHIFKASLANPNLLKLWSIENQTFADWFWLMVLSACAMICLPRQFHIAVVENVDETHVFKAAWLFPLYLWVINLFVLPVAFAGSLHFNSNIAPDFYLLHFPVQAQKEAIALVVFIGGLSAATGMVIVATVALSTMFSNQLVMPLLLRIPKLQLEQKRSLTGLIIFVRRFGILLILMAGYFYFKTIGEHYALVSIGLISFAAVAQFMPALVAALFWKDATKKGALAALLGGFMVWLYTLFLPSLAESNLISSNFIENGLFGLHWLKPYALFGFDHWNSLSHALFWSFLVNIGLLIGISLFTHQSKSEKRQAAAFVDILYRGEDTNNALIVGKINFKDVQDLLVRFLGKKKTTQVLSGHLAAYEHAFKEDPVLAQNNLVQFAENQLSAVIGSASAKLMTSSVIQDIRVDMEELILAANETQQIIQTNKVLEARSHTLAELTQQLTETNHRLQELDRLKNEFVSTVTHELRTPLTAIRALSEILDKHQDISEEERKSFIALIAQESERLSHLINDVLDLEKLESGMVNLNLSTFVVADLIKTAMNSVKTLAQNKGIQSEIIISGNVKTVTADFDRLVQVLVNLLSNAIKFCPAEKGEIRIKVRKLGKWVKISIADNGIGISLTAQKAIFDKFHQVTDAQRGKPKGSGLGLSIVKQIVLAHQGRIALKSKEGEGAEFIVSIPILRDSKKVS